MAEQSTVPVKAGNGKLRRWDPFGTFDELQEELMRFWRGGWPFAPTLLRRPLGLAEQWTPRLDVYEKDNTLVVKAELPGIAKDDIQVTLEGGDLVLQGESKAEREVKEENYYRMERSYGSFYRRLPLPFEVKPNQVQAHYTDGVLEVRIPKPAEVKPEPQKIAVG